MKKLDIWRCGMKKFALGFMMTLILSNCAPAPVIEYRYVDSSENVSHLQQSVVAIVSENEQGRIEGPKCTAFYIAPRKLATALHCVEPQRVISVQIMPGLILQIGNEGEEPTLGREILFVDWKEHRRFTRNWDADSEPNASHSTVIAIDQENDIAILELVDSEPSSNHWLTIAQRARVGERVYAMGMPRNQFWLLSEGIVSAIQVYGSGSSRVFHHNLTAPGSSGSPLINNFGEVIGVTIQYVRDVPNLGVATPSAVLQKLIDDGRQEPIYMSLEEVMNLLTNDSCNPNSSSCPLPQSPE